METKDYCKKPRTSRISPDQLDYLVTFMENNPELKDGILTPSFSKFDRKRKWEQLSEELNGLGGSIKTPELWKKVSEL